MAEAGPRPGGVQLVTIDERNDGQRLDNFLLSHLKGVPRSWVYRVLRRGEVRVNRGRSKPARRLHRGDVVRIPPLRTAQPSAHSVPEKQIEKITKSIIFEDDLILAINKPAGLAVHGGSGLSYGVIELLRAARAAAPYLELAHRLDRETSGCLLLAKRRSALRRLQELQRQGAIEKRYLALLHGRVGRDAWRVDVPLKKNTLRSGERVVRVDATGKPSVTEFRVLQRFAACTLVEAQLKTGRTHQIRVHAAHQGTPIVGDPKYGDAAADRRLPGGARRLCLHAATLAFDWPENERLLIEAPLPSEFQEQLEEVRVSDW